MPKKSSGSSCTADCRDQRGAALMIVLVVLVGLTILGAAGLTMTEVEIRHSENVEASTRAFYAADAGLQQYLGSSANGTASDTFTVGSSTVIVTPTLFSNLAGGQPMYHVRSVATHTAGAVTTSRAVRALAMYVSPTSSPLTVSASIASGSGLKKNGDSGTISGFDDTNASDQRCPEGPGADLAGIAVPPGGYDQNGGSSVPEGDPDIDESMDAESLMENTGVDWEGLTEDPPADYTVPPDDWPDFGALPDNEWPVIFVEGDISLGNADDGRGTIIVTDNVTFTGNFDWEGVILVGGRMDTNGNNKIHGAVITGLDILLGESVAESDLGNGTKTFQYNSCYVQRAKDHITANQSGMALVPGSWSEEI